MLPAWTVTSFNVRVTPTVTPIWGQKHTASLSMVISCCAYAWANRIGKRPGLQFYSFPADRRRRDLWIKAVRQKKWLPSKTSRICSDHFVSGKSFLKQQISTGWAEGISCFSPVRKESFSSFDGGKTLLLFGAPFTLAESPCMLFPHFNHLNCTSAIRCGSIWRIINFCSKIGLKQLHKYIPSYKMCCSMNKTERYTMCAPTWEHTPP